MPPCSTPDITSNGSVKHQSTIILQDVPSCICKINLTNFSVLPYCRKIFPMFLLEMLLNNFSKPIKERLKRTCISLACCIKYQIMKIWSLQSRPFLKSVCSFYRMPWTFISVCMSKKERERLVIFPDIWLKNEF